MGDGLAKLEAAFIQICRQFREELHAEAERLDQAQFHIEDLSQRKASSNEPHNSSEDYRLFNSKLSSI